MVENRLKHGHVRRRNWRPIVTALLITGALTAQAPAGAATAPTTIRGKVVSLSGGELLVVAPGGDTKIIVADKTVIRVEVPIRFDEIGAGMYLGTTATKQPDGTFLASEVHVFSEDQRGTGEGHRPLGGAAPAGATMTNANVERVEDMVVRDIKGRLLTLKYKDGEVKVFVPPDIRLVKRVMGDRSLVKPGSEVTVSAISGPDGSFSARQITVRAMPR